MSNQSDEIRQLLRQRGEQNLPDGFIDNFMVEFQSRQRSELLNHSARGLFFERLGTYFSGFGAPRWAGAAAGACAIALVTIFLFRGEPTPPDTSREDSGLAAHEVHLTPADLAEQRARIEFVAPVSLQFSEDLHPTRSLDHFLVEAEGPFSDLYILHPAGYAPDSRSSYFRQF